MEKKFANLIIQLKKGDITKQPDIDAIVNAANAELKIGGGVAGAIHRAGDPELERETRPLAPISPGEAVITNAPGLPNKHVIHCLGPVFGRDEPSNRLLADCYRNALKCAEDKTLSSVAFPAISTGAFGFPMQGAAKIALETVKNEVEFLHTVQLVRFVLFGDKAYNIHSEELQEL